jgi:leucine dehydrogenase
MNRSHRCSVEGAMFDNPFFDAHERVLSVHDRDSGLKAFIAVHSTHRGPAAGGCRLWRYDHADEAMGDALRLSRAMSYKNAMAGLPFGGGKAVVMGPLGENERRATFEALGEAIDSLGGVYVTAEDVGVKVADMQAVASRTKHVTGLVSDEHAAGGDPSPWTARGVRRGIGAVAEQALGRGDLEGLSVAIQGVGAVGSNLCRELAERGVRLIVADIDAARVEEMCDKYEAERADISEVLFAEVDIVAPCALGHVISAEAAAKLRARAIAGGANNQLVDAAAGRALFDRQIAYAPDYVINAGGIIAVAAEYLADAAHIKVAAAVDAIHGRVLDLVRRAQNGEGPSNQIADAMARRLIGRG